jgi:aryl-alcohol dehydrogenase-like predicted oxidoreductase
VIKGLIPGTDIKLSPICLGTMRLADKGLIKNDVCSLIRSGLDKGINTHHISDEYNSFALICESYKQLKKEEREQLQVICKLSGPHFNEPTFNSLIMKKRVEKYLLSLDVERLAVIQWMWRMNPLDDDVRLLRMADKLESIKNCFFELKSEGKVGDVACFPYSAKFMKQVRQLGICKGQINYVNIFENNALDVGLNEYTIALRPLAAGQINKIPSELWSEHSNQLGYSRNWTSAQHALAYSLSSPQVISAIVSLNNNEHLNAAIDVVENLPRDLTLNNYKSILDALREFN